MTMPCQANEIELDKGVMLFHRCWPIDSNIIGRMCNNRRELFHLLFGRFIFLVCRNRINYHRLALAINAI